MPKAKDGESLAGPATPAGPPLAIDAADMKLIREAEQMTLAHLNAQPLVEFVAFRHVWGDKAVAILNGIRVEIPADSKPHRVPQQIYDMMSARQSAALEQEAAAQARAGR